MIHSYSTQYSNLICARAKPCIRNQQSYYDFVPTLYSTNRHRSIETAPPLAVVQAHNWANNFALACERYLPGSPASTFREARCYQEIEGSLFRPCNRSKRPNSGFMAGLYGLLNPNSAPKLAHGCGTIGLRLSSESLAKVKSLHGGQLFIVLVEKGTAGASNGRRKRRKAECFRESDPCTLLSSFSWWMEGARCRLLASETGLRMLIRRWKTRGRKF